MSKSNTETRAGNYFISNYPPYSFWKREYTAEALAALERAAKPEAPIGVYVHIPFCRKRCHFCYFRIYTDKKYDDITRYLRAVETELSIYAAKPIIGGRKPNVIYFGGGTPSYLSVKQLTSLTESMKQLLPWDEAEEVTFECEPGTLTKSKLQFLRHMGVTRLSLGVEHWDEEILHLNGRAHGRKEIDRVAEWLQEIDFPQVNIDLIAGMIGDTDEKWKYAVDKTVEMMPTSVTIYQMEVPYNTTIYEQMKNKGEDVAPVADWQTKRRWVNDAFECLAEVGYSVNSTCTVVRNPTTTKFLYREHLFRGADLIGLGVASFGHLNNTHYQNEDNWGAYLRRLEAKELPIARALTPTPKERLIREMILQFKLGAVDLDPLQRKYGVKIRETFSEQLEDLRVRGYLSHDGATLKLSREGLLQVDSLMLSFFLPQHQSARYS